MTAILDNGVVTFTSCGIQQVKVRFDTYEKGIFKKGSRVVANVPGIKIIDRRANENMR